MEEKFKMLRVVGTIYKVLAWIVLVIGVLSALGVLGAGIWGQARLIRPLGMPPRALLPRWVGSREESWALWGSR